MTSAPGANTYRVGDFVYFDDPTMPDAPYQIRKIDEINKTKDKVEARVVSFMRRRDVPENLLKIADQAQRRFDNYYEVDKKKPENYNARGFIVAAAGAENGAENDAEVKKEEAEDDAEKPESPSGTTTQIDWGNGGLPLGAETLSDAERLKLRQHEVFLSRQSTIMPAHQIRGKCHVALLGEVEDCSGYLAADDTFFYSLVYDPVNQTLLADKGAIRVGEKYQAVMDAEDDAEAEADAEGVKKEEKMEMDEEEEEENGLKIDEESAEPAATKLTTKITEEIDRDVQVYHPYHELSEREIDQFLIIARAVGTFARAIDSSAATKIPTLHMAAACASRDVTILHAMSLLHHANYDVGKAVKFLVPTANKQHYPLETDKATGNHTQTLGGPLLCRDQMEEWSVPEANLFDEALEKCGKDFNDIRADFLPWKSMRDIVEYYYQFKASNRYTERKKAKQAEADTKLKQVYIPSYNKTTSAVIGTFNMTQTQQKSPIPCENCQIDESQNWYSWGGKSDIRLCQNCWFKWKKSGGLSKKHELERFDKDKPPVLAPAAPQVQNGAAAKLPQAQQASRAPVINNQALLVAAKQAYAKGTITKAQLCQLQASLGGAGSLSGIGGAVGGQGISTPVVVAKPASKPNIVYYTTICRRVIRRILPKTALNSRKLARKPFSTVDHEAIMKNMTLTDRSTLIQTAKQLAGEKYFHKIQESEFNKGIVYLQHTISAAAASGKRPASQISSAGEPAPKLQKN
ncbi:unnamed protein product [Caenorhabditis angaria]|uniref:Uncharacterized protein n=1 Tax=Caenorhabditis angaria TaxID=860376 RepID=A0A9P1IVS8_9PELO|nr:unnamed protein product [Caenorhabditis angaria]